MNLKKTLESQLVGLGKTASRLKDELELRKKTLAVKPDLVIEAYKKSADLKSVDVHVFSEHHVTILTELLASSSGKWREICWGLHLPSNVQTNLESRLHIYDELVCLRKVLRERIVGNREHAWAPTLMNLKKALESQLVGLNEMSSQLVDQLEKYDVNLSKRIVKPDLVREAYKKAITEKLTLKLRPIRFNYVGLPRSGKTCFRHCLMGKFVNILAALAKGKYEQPSTGLAENGGLQVITRRLSLEMGVLQSNVWSSIRDLREESDMLNQLIYQMVSNKQPSAPDEEVVDANSPIPVTQSEPSSVQQSSSTAALSSSVQQSSTAALSSSVQQSSSTATLSLVDAEIEETFSMITKAIDTNDLDMIKVLLDDLTLLINTDTGGQAEFLDLQASLVQGPSFNLLFSRLVDNLDSLFQVYYTNEKGKSTEKEYSTMTVAEVLFQTLSSIACFGGCFLDSETMSSEYHKHQVFSMSKVMLVGTHLDLVTDEEFKRKDQLLQQMIQNSEFVEKDIIEFAFKDQLMLAVDNMNGSQDEIDGIWKVLERVIERSFEKIDIPASWLALSLYIRQKQLRVISLEECVKWRLNFESVQKSYEKSCGFFTTALESSYTSLRLKD